MKKIYSLFAFAALCFGGRAMAQPTWADDVAPILYAKCTTCHNPTGIAPFSLMTYADASSMSYNIQQAVTAGRMPPWPPDTTYSRLAHERILKSSERQSILNWISAGTPSGNLSNAPTPPTYSSAGQIVNPDVSVQMPTYTVSSTTDIYRCFVMPAGNTQNEYITELEVLPGNRSIVHHVLVYGDAASTCVTLDNNDPGPGYTNFGGPGSNTATLIGAWVPGQTVYTLPAGMGIQLAANSYIIIQVHYPAGAVGQTDSTRVQMKFSSGTVRNVSLAPVLNHAGNMTDGPLYIPANTTQTFHEQASVAINATVLSVAPHMHLIGKSIKTWAVDPNNDTIPFISIPDWNFMWQGSYSLPRLVKVPFGSTLYSEAFYDNTSNNDLNPNNPPQLVTAGEATTDEMMLTYFAYTPYQPGDENIIVDSAAVLASGPQIMNDIAKTAQLYAPYPVPAAESVTASFFLPEKGRAKLELIDINGNRVALIADEEMPAGYSTKQVGLTSIAHGTYLLRLTHNGITRTKKIVKE